MSGAENEWRCTITGVGCSLESRHWNRRFFPLALSGQWHHFSIFTNIGTQIDALMRINLEIFVPPKQQN